MNNKDTDFPPIKFQDARYRTQTANFGAIETKDRPYHMAGYTKSDYLCNRNHTQISYDQNIDSYIPWRRYRQRTALLRADDAPRAHSPLLFSMGYIHGQYPRKFPHRAILYLIRPFQPFY